ncbi:TatD family hydrolase, partial [bacterium]|nr:TatD family hydrolase [bacterium]
PAERLLVETDAPFLSPEPVRGRPCEPAFMVHTARQLVELGADSQQLYQNALDIFGVHRV